MFVTAFEVMLSTEYKPGHHVAGVL